MGVRYRVSEGSGVSDGNIWTIQFMNVFDLLVMVCLRLLVAITPLKV